MSAPTKVDILIEVTEKLHREGNFFPRSQEIKDFIEDVSPSLHEYIFGARSEPRENSQVTDFLTPYSFDLRLGRHPRAEGREHRFTKIDFGDGNPIWAPALRSEKK